MASTVLPNGIIIPEKYSRDWYNDLYHNWQELDNLLGGGTPKDGTLTIQKNGTAVGTFSANQATNETVNIEVPTKTSDLTNDSGFITGVSWNDVADKPSFATVATSGSYTDLSDKPTIPTVNNATLTIQQNGATVDSFSANSSNDKTVNIQCVDLTNNQTVGGNKEFTGTTTAHDLVPSATDTYNFGSSTKKWKSFNGVNPGALSLPSMAYISLDTTSFDVTATTIGAFTPTIDGWAILSITQKNKPFGIWILQGSYRITFGSVYHQGDYIIFALIPVWTNLSLTIYCTADDIDSTRKVDWLRLFPCQGNV